MRLCYYELSAPVARRGDVYDPPVPHDAADRVGRAAKSMMEQACSVMAVLSERLVLGLVDVALVLQLLEVTDRHPRLTGCAIVIK